MRCPACGVANPDAAWECEACGEPLRAPPPREPEAPGPGRRRTWMHVPEATAELPAPPFERGTPSPDASPPPRRKTSIDAVSAARRAYVPPPTPPPSTAPRSAAPPASTSEVSAKPQRTVVARPAAASVLGVLVAYPAPGANPSLHPLPRGRTGLGRDASLPVHIPDPRVSSLHGFIFVEPGAASYADMSTNGSLVDGQLVHGRTIDLRPGARIQVGDTLLVFQRLPEPPQASAWSR